MNFHMPTQDQLAAELQSIPMLSRCATQVLDIMNDSGRTVSDITRVIETDATLTAHILRTVNSAAFSLAQKVESLERAISYIGENSIVSIAISHCSASLLNKPLDGYESEGKELWAHSLRTAIATREISGVARKEINSSLAYTAGLLHDIGKSIISRFLIGTTQRILAQLENGEVEDYLEAERRSIGIDHCTAGGNLAAIWDLPVSIHDAIRYHHHPAEAPEGNRPLVYAVHLGEFVSMMEGVGTGADCMNYRLDPGYIEYLDVNPGTLEELIITVDDEFKKALSALMGDEIGA